jgi:DNA-binding NarL/FixJ family response regulator
MPMTRPRALRVLLADPDVATRAEVRRLLAADGRFVVCVEVEDAAAAVAAAIALRPDLCLLEVDMPGEGLAAAWEITSRLPAVDVVVLTSSERDEDLMTALRVGVSGYLLKSDGYGRLLHAIWDIHQGTFAMPRRLMARVVQQLRGTEPRRRTVVPLDPRGRLTSREWEVLDLLASGLSTREAADRLSLSPTAIRVHAASVVKKLGARDREEALAAFGVRRRDPIEATG